MAHCSNDIPSKRAAHCSKNYAKTQSSNALRTTALRLFYSFRYVLNSASSQNICEIQQRPEDQSHKNSQAARAFQLDHHEAKHKSHSEFLQTNDSSTIPNA